MEEARLVLLAKPDATLLAPLVKLLLLDQVPSTQAVWDRGQLSAIKLRDVI